MIMNLMSKFCFPAFFGFLLFSIANAASAQSPDFCSVPLAEKAYDRTNSEIKSSIMFSSRDDICSFEYRSIGEARSAARNRGFDLGYKGVSIGASEAKQTQSGRWDISDTSFCRASSSNFRSAYSSKYQSQVARAAVSAWLECVRLSTENALYIDYEVDSSGQYFSGTLRTTANTGTLERRITGITVVGPAKDNVECTIGGATYRPNKVASSPIEVRTTGTSVACEKDSDDKVSIAFQTSQGSTEFIKLPSRAELTAQIERDRNEEIRRREEEANRLPKSVTWEFENTMNWTTSKQTRENWDCFRDYDKRYYREKEDIVSIRSRPINSENWGAELLKSERDYKDGLRRVTTAIMRPGIRFPVRRNCQHEVLLEFEQSGKLLFETDICYAGKMIIRRDSICRGAKTYKNR